MTAATNSPAPRPSASARAPSERVVLMWRCSCGCSCAGTPARPTGRRAELAELAGEPAQRVPIEHVVGERATPLGLDDARLAEHAQVVAHEGLREVEVLDEVTDAEVLDAQPADDLPAHRIAEDLQGGGAHGSINRVRINRHEYQC